MRNSYIKWVFLLIISSSLWSQEQRLRLGVDGLSHGHVAWVFKHADNSTFELVGIAEPNFELAKRML